MAHVDEVEFERFEGLNQGFPRLGDLPRRREASLVGGGNLGGDAGFDFNQLQFGGPFLGRAAMNGGAIGESEVLHLPEGQR